MQLATIDREVTSSGALDSKEQGIILDATMFTMLSDGLYSDKIGAAVREVYSNAMDSHLAAGKPKQPARVKLPTPLDPSFSVKDQGLGLDHGGVMDVAGEYGLSTKRHENDSIGGFGIGFNSPYAAADQWSIVAIKDGIKRTYSCFKNEHGRPSISQLSEVSTVEPNGVEIIIPSDDHNAWRDAVQEQLQWFPQRPIITGGEVEWPTYNRQDVHDASGKLIGTLLSKNDNSSGYSSDRYSWRALAGGVAIPINLSKVSGDMDRRSAFLRTGGVLYFDIGDVLPDPSREGLQYTPKVIEAIELKMKQLFCYVQAAAQNKVDTASNQLDAYRIAGEVAASGSASFYRGSFLTYNGEPLTNTMQGQLSRGMAYHITSYDLRSDRLTLRVNGWQNNINISRRFIDTSLIFIDDLPGPNHRQAFRVLQEVNRRKELGEKLDVVIVLRNGTLDDVKSPWAKHYPKSQIVNLSSIEIPKPVRSPSASGPKPNVLPKVRLATAALRESSNMSAHCSGPTALEFSFPDVLNNPESGVYVITNSGTIDDQTMALLNLPEILPGNVCLVPATLRKTVEDSPDWTCFRTAADAYIKLNYRPLRKEFAKMLGEHKLMKVVSEFRLAPLFRAIRDSQGLVQVPQGSTRSAPWKLYKEWLNTDEPLLENYPRLSVFRKLEESKLPAFQDIKACSVLSEKARLLEEKIKDQNPVLVEFFGRYGSRPRLTEKVLPQLVSRLF